MGLLDDFNRYGLRSALLAPRHVLTLATAGLALVTAGCGAVEVSQLPLQDDFSDCSDFTMNDEVATVDCPDGKLRVLVSQPERSPIHIVPFRFDPSEPGLVVEADVRLAHGEGAYGIGCAVSEPGEPGRGYLFLMLHGDPNAEGIATITRLDWTRPKVRRCKASNSNERLFSRKSRTTCVVAA